MSTESSPMTEGLSCRTPNSNIRINFHPIQQEGADIVVSADINGITYVGEENIVKVIRRSTLKLYAEWDGWIAKNKE